MRICVNGVAGWREVMEYLKYVQSVSGLALEYVERVEILDLCQSLCLICWDNNLWSYCCQMVCALSHCLFFRTDLATNITWVEDGLYGGQQHGTHFVQ